MSTNGVGPAATNPESPTSSPRSLSTSLQATAAVNAGLQHGASRRSSNGSAARARTLSQAGGRRADVLNSLQLNDPTVPAPGEMISENQSSQATSPPFPSGSPQTWQFPRGRAPSLGEIHQELEAEQEAHVNRLLQAIRQQQLELQRLQSGQQHQGQSSSAEDSSAIADRSIPSTPQPASVYGSVNGHSASRSFSRTTPAHHPRSSFDLARTDLHRTSRTPSQGASPRLRSGSISAESSDWVTGGRDESAFYQAETQMLVRENQMLRHRVRDLEKQLADLSGTPASTHEPAVSSTLQQSSTTAEVAAGGAD